MTEAERLNAIAEWCRLWLSGETDRRYTEELIAGIEKLAHSGTCVESVSYVSLPVAAAPQSGSVV
jgi:hypothetical protein